MKHISDPLTPLSANCQGRFAMAVCPVSGRKEKRGAVPAARKRKSRRSLQLLRFLRAQSRPPDRGGMGVAKPGSLCSLVPGWSAGASFQKKWIARNDPAGCFVLTC